MLSHDSECYQWPAITFRSSFFRMSAPSVPFLRLPVLIQRLVLKDLELLELWVHLIKLTISSLFTSSESTFHFSQKDQNKLRNRWMPHFQTLNVFADPMRHSTTSCKVSRNASFEWIPSLFSSPNFPFFSYFLIVTVSLVAARPAPLLFNPFLSDL